MKITLTLPSDIVDQLDTERGDRKYQPVIVELLRRATLPDPHLLVLEAALAAKDEEIARLHATLRALAPGTSLPPLTRLEPEPTPSAPPLATARIEDW